MNNILTEKQYQAELLGILRDQNVYTIRKATDFDRRFALDSEINGGSLKSEALKTTKKLRTWVNNTPLYLQLQWFDTVEQVEISTKLRSRRWNTEVTSCDALYLEKIGLYREC